MNLRSVMIVDDNESDRYLLKRLLVKGDVTEHFFEAADGNEAIEFLRAYGENCKLHPGKFPPIVVFLDINMPRMNGFEFLEAFAKLRAEQPYDSVVLMMFSSSERQEERDKALAYEFVTGFISKMPRKAQTLAEQVARAIATKRERDTLTSSRS